MIRKSILIFTSFIMVSLSAATLSAQNRQVTPEMIQQAKAAGYDVSGIGAGQNSSQTTQVSDYQKASTRARDNAEAGSYGRQGKADIKDTTDIRGLSAFDWQQQQQIRQQQKTIDDSILRNSVFGREIFSKNNLTFAPSYNQPTPVNYVLGAGDRIYIDLWGSTDANYDLQISPDGAVTIPRVGVVPLAGLTIEQAEKRIRNRMQESMSGLEDGSIQIKISLGDIRSIKINIIGEATTPGTYNLPSLATLFNALYAAGGVNNIGSLRNIKLVRDNKEIATLDVYDYLIRGKQEVNVGLRDNDLIVVSPYENLAKVDGQVKRPRIYELRKNETLQDLLGYAGGFRGEAYSDNISVARKSGRQQTIHSVPKAEFEAFAMTDGDSISVGEIIRRYANRVTIEGAVWRPGDFQIGEEVKTLKQLVGKAEGLRGDALLSRAQIIRQKPDFTFDMIAIDLGELMNGRIQDVELQPEDIVRIPSINSLREAYTINVKGEVNDPKTLPFSDNMTIQDAILLASGLKESASLARIEVARRIKNPNSTEPSARSAEIFSFSIPADMVLNPETAVFKLEPFDEVYIRRSPEYKEQESVFAQGELLFAGEYVLSSNHDRLTDLVAKAGGLTPEAYPQGAFLRRQATLNRAARARTTADLMARGKAATGDTLAMKVIQPGDYESVAIDLVAAMKNPNGPQNLILQKGDRLSVPKYNATVTISGGVLYPCTVTYIEGERIQDYIAKGGGYAERARKRPFIVYANGQPAAKHGGRYPKVQPGCEIIVPMKGERKGLSTAEIISLSSSVVSMAAMVTSLFK